MDDVLIRLACILTLAAAVGCSVDPSGGDGLTYEQAESSVAQSTETESTTPEDAEPTESAIADAPTETIGPETVAADPAADASAGPPDAAEITPPEAGETETDVTVTQTGAVELALTPEQQEALAGIELSPEQWSSLATIQLQPDYEEMVFFKVRDSDALRVQFDNLDLQLALNMTYIPPFATDYFPQWMLDLDGKRVRMRGFMYTSFDDVPQFLLCRDLGICCFGPNPRSDYRIPVTLQAGETTDYIHQIAFDVEGTFHVHLVVDDLGKVSSVYAITDATIIRL
jgi:hypothetical protein